MSDNVRSMDVRRTKLIALTLTGVVELDYNKVNWPGIGGCIELTSMGADDFTNERNRLDEISRITDLEFTDNLDQVFFCGKSGMPLHGGYRRTGTTLNPQFPLI